MSTDAKTRTVAGRIGDIAIWVGGLLLLALCCGGAALAAFGIGAILAILLSPWFLIPAVAGGAYWNYRVKRNTCTGAECRLCGAKATHRAMRRETLRR